MRSWVVAAARIVSTAVRGFRTAARRHWGRGRAGAGNAPGVLRRGRAAAHLLRGPGAAGPELRQGAGAAGPGRRPGADPGPPQGTRAVAGRCVLGWWQRHV